MKKVIVYIKIPVVINYDGKDLKTHVKKLFKRDVYIDEKYEGSIQKSTLEQKAILERVEELNQ